MFWFCIDFSKDLVLICYCFWSHPSLQALLDWQLKKNKFFTQPGSCALKYQGSSFNLLLFLISSFTASTSWPAALEKQISHATWLMCFEICAYNYYDVKNTKIEFWKYKPNHFILIFFVWKKFFEFWEDRSFRSASIIRCHFAINKWYHLKTNFESEKCYNVANLVLLQDY